MDFILGRLVGLAVGVCVGLIICFIAFRKMNKDGKLKTEYDERQTEIRGKGYQIGFWAEAIFFALLMLLDIAEVEIPAVKTVIYFSGIMFGIVVMYSYCIWKGAYFGLNNDAKRWTLFLIFFGVLNLFIGYIEYFDGSLIVDGILMPGFVNVLCGIMLLLAVALHYIRKTIDSKETASDEES